VTKLLDIEMNVNDEKEEAVLTIGNLNLAFSEWKGNMKYGVEQKRDSTFYLKYGEMQAYLICLETLGCIDKQQVETLRKHLEDINSDFDRILKRRISESRIKYCQYCGNPFLCNPQHG